MNLNKKEILLCLLIMNTLVLFSLVTNPKGNSKNEEILKTIDKDLELISYQSGLFLDTLVLGELLEAELFIFIDINVCSICRDMLLGYLQTHTDETRKVVLLLSGYVEHPRFLKFLDLKDYDYYLINSCPFEKLSSSEAILFTVSKPMFKVEKCFVYNKDNAALELFIRRLT